MEVGRLNGVIRRLEETPALNRNERDARAETVLELRRRVVEIFDAIDALGDAQAGEEDPSDGE